jgi:hypothetical protein
MAESLGSITKIEFVYADQVTSWPAMMPDYTLDGYPIFEDGVEWTELATTYEVSALSDKGGDDEERELSLTVVISGMDSTNHTLSETIRNRGLIVRLTDGNGVQHLMGTPDAPCYFTFNRGTGSSPGDRNGYTGKMETRTTGPLPLYEWNGFSIGLMHGGVPLVHEGVYLKHE